METHDFTRLAFGVGIVALLAAWIGVLVRRTRGVPPLRRVVMMLKYTLLAGWSLVPPRWFFASAAAAIFAFASVFSTSMSIVFLVIWMIPPAVPHPTEAYEGIGDALILHAILTGGAVISFCLAIVAAFIAYLWMASRWHKSNVVSPSDAE